MLKKLEGRFERYENGKNIADIALSCMEDNGMLPPNTMRYVDQENGNTLCSEVCEWDEE